MTLRNRFLIITFVGVAACSSQRGRDPVDPERLEWPLALAVDPAGDFLYAVSSNFDTARTGSMIVAISLDTFEIVPQSAVQVGSFAGEIVVAPNSEGFGGAGYVAVRDGDRVEFFFIERKDGVPVLKCSKETPRNQVPRCEPDFQLSPTVNERIRDPFAVALGTSEEGRPSRLYVGSLVDGLLAVMPIGTDLSPRSGPFVRLSPGIHSIVEGPRLANGWHRVFVSNRVINAVHVVDVLADHSDVTIRVMENLSIGQVASTGDYFRGMAVSNDKRTLYAALRSAASLVVFDILDDGTTTLRGLVPLRGLPSGVAVFRGENGERVYVTDFSGNAIYCVNPLQLEVVDRIPVGQGPYTIVIPQAGLGRKRAFVSAFENHCVLVIDLDETSPTWHQVIKRIPSSGG